MRSRILVCDQAAAGAGVVAGQRLSTALGLLPGLTVLERDAGGETRALEQLACWAGQFTPTVVLRPPTLLLLEIGACLRLFGGAGRIVQAALDGLSGQGWSMCWAAAPTPLAADWLARAGHGAIADQPAAVHAALAALPVALPDWPGEVRRRLETFGLRCLGDLRRLPSASLRQRLGSAPLDDLLRAWGELPDPQTPFVFPESFHRRLELPARVDYAEGLAFAGQRLFAALVGWLNARQLLLYACRLELEHDDGSRSELAVGFGEPVADEARFLRLLREHLSRLQLAAPVEALGLVADRLVARSGVSPSLFDEAPAGEGRQACLERLQARLGEAALGVLAAPADYRPECASREVSLAVPPAGGADAVLTAGLRPLWLLPEPQPLIERGGVPCWPGPLKLQSRPERLESGWWDAGEAERPGDVRRDYFVARNAGGQWAWIFRDARGWFLHGLFA